MRGFEEIRNGKAVSQGLAHRVHYLSVVFVSSMEYLWFIDSVRVAVATSQVSRLERYLCNLPLEKLHLPTKYFLSLSLSSLVKLMEINYVMIPMYFHCQLNPLLT